jgi:hypothetical protein
VTADRRAACRASARLGAGHGGVLLLVSEGRHGTYTHGSLPGPDLPIPPPLRRPSAVDVGLVPEAGRPGARLRRHGPRALELESQYLPIRRGSAPLDSPIPGRAQTSRMVRSNSCSGAAARRRSPSRPRSTGSGRPSRTAGERPPGHRAVSTEGRRWPAGSRGLPSRPARTTAPTVATRRRRPGQHRREGTCGFLPRGHDGAGITVCAVGCAGVGRRRLERTTEVPDRLLLPHLVLVSPRRIQCRSGPRR